MNWKYFSSHLGIHIRKLCYIAEHTVEKINEDVNYMCFCDIELYIIGFSILQNDDTLLSYAIFHTCQIYSILSLLTNPMNN